MSSVTENAQAIQELTDRFNEYQARIKKVDSLQVATGIIGDELVVVFQGSKTVKVNLNELLPYRFIILDSKRFFHIKINLNSNNLEIGDVIQGVYLDRVISAKYLGGNQDDLANDAVWDKSTIG